jgi:hypothetical protein
VGMGTSSGEYELGEKFGSAVNSKFEYSRGKVVMN